MHAHINLHKSTSQIQTPQCFVDNMDMHLHTYQYTVLQNTIHGYNGQQS